jgi:hypothetical protein
MQSRNHTISLCHTNKNTHTHAADRLSDFPINSTSVNAESGNQGTGCPHYLGIEEMLLYRCPEGVRPEP